MLTRQIEGLTAEARASSRGPKQTLSPRGAIKVSARLHNQIVQDYQAGQRVVDIAETHGLSKTTVIDHLNQAGVTRRSLSMSQQQIDEAVGLYEGGLSLAKIGEQLGFTARTVHLRLLERGVRMRDTHGRVR